MSVRVEDIRAGDVVRLVDGNVVEVEGFWTEYHDAGGTHPGPGITSARTFEHFTLDAVAQVVKRNERVCRLCGGGVTSSNPAVDFCRMCFYTGRAFEDMRAEQLERFRSAFPGAQVAVEHTGGGCFWLALRWEDEPVYYVLTDGEAGLPRGPEGAALGSGGWGYVGRHSDQEDADFTPEYDGVELEYRPDALDDPYRYGMTDEYAIAVVLSDREAQRKGGAS